jgi:hypothetical protein
MTVGAVARDVRVVEVRWRPPDGRVAIITVVATGEVGRMFAGGGIAVMTGTATTEYLCVINSYYWQPTNRVMAILTDVSGLYVGRILAGRVRAVVAARAITGDVDMIEVRGDPTGGRVTIVAIVAADDVIGIFASRDYPVMTGAAGADHITVIDRKCGGESVCRMTVFTNICRENVARRFPNCVSTVMAGDAVADDVRVIKNRR